MHYIPPQNGNQQEHSPSNNTNNSTTTTTSTELLKNVIDYLVRRINGDEVCGGQITEITLSDSLNNESLKNDTHVNCYHPQSSSSSSTISSTPNDLMSVNPINMMHQQHVAEKSNNMWYNHSSTLPSSSNSVNNNNDVNNLFSLFDTHRDILLIEKELSRLKYRSNSPLNSCLMEEENANMNFRNQRTIVPSSKGTSSIINNTCDSNTNSGSAGVLELLQALHSVTDMSSPEHVLLSKLIWKELLDRSCNTSLHAGDIPNSIPSENQTSNIGEESGMFDSFKDILHNMGKSSSTPPFSQHYHDLSTSHPMQYNNTTSTNICGRDRIRCSKSSSNSKLSNAIDTSIMLNELIPTPSITQNNGTFKASLASAQQNQHLVSPNSALFFNSSDPLCPPLLNHNQQQLTLPFNDHPLHSSSSQIVPSNQQLASSPFHQINNKNNLATAKSIIPDINFSLTGDCESAQISVKTFSKQKKAKKNSNNIPASGESLTGFDIFSACVTHPIGHSKNNKSVGTYTVVEAVLNIHQPHHQNNLASPSLLLEENRVNISPTEESTSAHSSVINNKFFHTVLSTTRNNCQHDTNITPSELSPTTTLLLNENSLDTNLQYLNNISTDYTMSSNSPISSSSSNEQTNHGKQYQGVMPLEGNQASWGVKVNRKYRQLRKSLKTCKHFEDNYFVLELNGQGNPGNSSIGQVQPKPKARTRTKTHAEDKKQSIPIPYKEQVNLMGEFSVAKSFEDEVLPLSVLNRSEENDIYLTTPNSTSSASSKSSSARDFSKKRKNKSQEPIRKNRKKDNALSQQEMALGGLDSTIIYNNEILPTATMNMAPMQPMPTLENTEIFNKGVPDIMCYSRPNYNINQQIPSLISPHNPREYHPNSATTTFINYENTTKPNITSSNNQINQTENRNPFSSGFPSNNSFGLFSTTDDFTTMKLPSNNSIDSFFKSDLTDDKTANMPRNLSSSSDFLPLEEATIHHLNPIVNPIVNNHPITTTQVKIIPPKIDIANINISGSNKQVEKNQLTRCINNIEMSHASLSMLDEEEEEEHVNTKNVSNVITESVSTIENSSKEPEIEDIRIKSPLITPLNAVLYKNISVSNMDLVKLDVPSASVLRPIQSESEMVEKDHSHWIDEIKTLPSSDSLANMVDFDTNLFSSKKH